MDETDADRRAEMPEDSRKVAGGTGEKKERERQTSTAVKEKTQPEAEMLLEEVLRRENMLSALRRVRSNKGAPGMDGMTVEELVPYLKDGMATHSRGVAQGDVSTGACEAGGNSQAKRERDAASWDSDGLGSDDSTSDPSGVNPDL